MKGEGEKEVEYKSVGLELEGLETSQHKQSLSLSWLLTLCSSQSLHRLRSTGMEAGIQALIHAKDVR